MTELSISEYKKHLANKPKSKTAEKAFSYFESCLKEHGIKLQKEFLFLKNRKYRADMYFEINTNHALYDKKVVLEYDGLQMKIGGKQHRSGHTSIKGYTKDCERNNLAQLAGYICLRYTALSYKDFFIDLKTLLQS